MTNNRRFAVALSFPGEHRRFARNVAVRLAEKLGRERVFFDEWYVAELRGASADLKLQRIYRDETILVVPFFSEHYAKRWCQIEWHAIRVILAERREDDAVLPVRFDGTRIEGWESSIDLGIRKGHLTARAIADAIFDVYRLRDPTAAGEGDLTHQVAGKVKPALNLVHADAKPPAHRPLLRDLERSILEGELRHSLIAPIVLAALNEETEIELVEDYDRIWPITGIQLSDEYFVRVRPSAGERDWQRDFAPIATPTLVGLARSLTRSPESQALVIRLCNCLAKRLRLRVVWPKDSDSLNALTNAIYRASLNAKEIESDEVLIVMKGLVIVGPE